MNIEKTDTYGEGFDDGTGELLNLARDARATRRRTSIWTTSLIVAGMAGSTAYVSTVNNQLDALSAKVETAEAENQRLNTDVARLRNERDALTTERDVYKQNAAWFATMAPALATKPSGNEQTPVTPSNQEAPDFALSNLVWYVDGSRRFPMAERDILWIPEARIWIRLIANQRVEIHTGAQPPSGDAASQANAVFEGPYDLSNPESYYERDFALRGNADCVQIQLADGTGRATFGPAYSDMIVTYLNKQDCQNRLVRAQ